MGDAKQFRAIKGTRDILPPESAQWNAFEATARRVMESYGFGEIRLPIFEETELFARSIGADTEVVSKEMYTFLDRAPLEVEAMLQSAAASFGAGDITNEVNLKAFARDLLKLASGIQEAFVADKIPGTEANNERVGRLLMLANRVHSYAEGERSDITLKPVEVMNLAAQMMILVLRELQLGFSLSLRPEATASVCRAYIEHGMHTRPGNVKLYYIGPMFRRERPQKGRYRQFYQVGAEVLTHSLEKEETEKERLASAAIDAEVIEMLMHLFDAAGLTGCTLHLNSIGCKACRPKYVAALRAALEKVRDKLGPDSQRRIETNPLRVLDSKLPEEQAVIATLPGISEHLCEACRAHFAALKNDLTRNRGIAFEENWRLVRGLDYYVRTTFEITAPGLGSQNAVCGGGRYDGLVELLGGPNTRGIGFAIGTDRVMLSLAESTAHSRQLTAGLDVFVAWMGAAAYPAAVKLARKLRGAGFAVEMPAEEMKLKKSLGLADKLGARYALIIGENEVASGRYALKHLADAQQVELTEGELVEHLKGSKEVKK